MTAEEFLANIRDIYGGKEQPRQALIKRLRDWLKEQPEWSLEMIWYELERTFSRRWGKLPGIAELEAAKTAIATELEHESRSRISNTLLLPDRPEEEYDDAAAAEAIATLKRKFGKKSEQMRRDLSGEG